MFRWLRIAIVFAISASAHEYYYDVIVYGGTSAGVIAAAQSAKMGKSTVLIEPRQHLGGMTSSGLGFVDVGNTDVIGGYAREYFRRVWQYYQADGAWIWEPKQFMKGQFIGTPPSETMWVLEPHVAEIIFDGILNETNVKIERNERLDRKNGVLKQGQRIVRIAMESGKVFHGMMFIDATYEGDLMAAAGVSYTTGREGNSEYGETVNGIIPNQRRSELPTNKIDPYRIKGDPSSGLLPRIHQNLGGNPGDKDRAVQAYNFRMCLTNLSENRVMIEKPAGYNDLDYELVFRAIQCGLPREKFLKLSLVPNRKTDCNNCGVISTDYIGMSWNYIESDYDQREAIAKSHEQWQRGLIWTLQNHPRVHPKVKAYYADWGLAKDEFADNGHWPYQLYIREGRRMVSDVVITEQTALGQSTVQDPVGFGTYSIDSHAVKYYVAEDGFLMTDGCLYKQVVKPFPISYQAIVPKWGECENLLVPICLSATHVAYGSIRMEPILMVLGQSAATAACLAIDRHIPLQKLPYGQLREQLLNNGQIVAYP